MEKISNEEPATAQALSDLMREMTSEQKDDPTPRSLKNEDMSFWPQKWNTGVVGAEHLRRWSRQRSTTDGKPEPYVAHRSTF